MLWHFGGTQPGIRGSVVPVNVKVRVVDLQMSPQRELSHEDTEYGYFPASDLRDLQGTQYHFSALPSTAPTLQGFSITHFFIYHYELPFSRASQEVHRVTARGSGPYRLRGKGGNIQWYICRAANCTEFNHRYRFYGIRRNSFFQKHHRMTPKMGWLRMKDMLRDITESFSVAQLRVWRQTFQKTDRSRLT